MYVHGAYMLFTGPAARGSLCDKRAREELFRQKSRTDRRRERMTQNMESHDVFLRRRMYPRKRHNFTPVQTPENLTVFMRCDSEGIYAGVVCLPTKRERTDDSILTRKSISAEMSDPQITRGFDHFSYFFGFWSIFLPLSAIPTFSFRCVYIPIIFKPSPPHARGINKFVPPLTLSSQAQPSFYDYAYSDAFQSVRVQCDFLA